MFIFITVCVLGFSRETEPIGGVCVCMSVYPSIHGGQGGDIYFKGLAHAVVEAWYFKMYRVGWRPGEELQFESKGNLAEFLLLGRSGFFLLRSSTD